jgi:hypothetical protein
MLVLKLALHTLKELQMRKSNLNLYDGIGTWKRRPIRAGKKTYIPSHKRWGKITVTKMTPTPEGVITTTEILQPVVEVVPEKEEEKK